MGVRPAGRGGHRRDPLAHPGLRRPTPTRGFSLGVLEVPPGARLAPHHHRPQEVYYVVAGEAEVLVAGAWRPALAGDVVYIPGDEAHGARNRGDTVCRIIWAFPIDDYDDVEYVDDQELG